MKKLMVLIFLVFISVNILMGISLFEPKIETLQLELYNTVEEAKAAQFYLYDPVEEAKTPQLAGWDPFAAAKAALKKAAKAAAEAAEAAAKAAEEAANAAKEAAAEVARVAREAADAAQALVDEMADAVSAIYYEKFSVKIPNDFSFSTTSTASFKAMSVGDWQIKITAPDGTKTNTGKVGVDLNHKKISQEFIVDQIGTYTIRLYAYPVNVENLLESKTFQVSATKIDGNVLMDNDPPTGISFNKTQIENTIKEDLEYIHYTPTNVYINPSYFNVLGRKGQVFWSAPTDNNQSGVISLKLSISDTNLLGINPTSRQFDEGDMGETLSLTAVDAVGNAGISEDNITVVKDDTEPTFTFSSLEYAPFLDEGVESFYVYSYLKDFNDGTGSGCKINTLSENLIFQDYNFDNNLISQEGAGEKETIDGIHYSKRTMQFFVRDEKLTLKTYIYDNVTNKSKVDSREIMLSAAVRILDTDDTDLYYKDGVLHYKGQILLGENALDSSMGVDSVTFSINGHDYIVNHSVKPCEQYIGEETYTDELDNTVTRPTYNGVKFDIDVSSAGLLPHRIYKVKVKTKHKHVTDPEERIFYTKPVENRGIQKMSLNIKSSYYFDGVDPLDLSSAVFYGNNVDNVVDAINRIPDTTPITTIYGKTKPNTPNSLGIIADFILDTQTTLSDIDFDTLTYYNVEKEGYYYIYITEQYSNDILKNGKEILKGVNKDYYYLLTGYRYKYDHEIDTNDLEIVIANKDTENVYNNSDYVTKTNNINIKLNVLNSYSSIIDDISGIKSVSFFNVPESQKDNLISFFDESILVDDFVEYNSSANYLNYNLYSLDNIDDYTEGYVYVAARIADNAGNVGYISAKNVLIDRVHPVALLSDNAIITFNNDNILEDINFTYAYDNTNGDQIYLNINPRLIDYSINDLEDHLYEYLRGLDAVTFDDKPVYISDVTLQNGSIVISLDTGHVSYIGNQEINIDIKLTDFANNITTSSLRFYTPGKVEITDITTNRHNNRRYADWDNELGNFIDFTINEFGNYTNVNLYKVKVDDTIGHIIIGRDKGLSAHELNTYRYKSINGSGFENSKDDSHVKNRKIVAGNNSPKIEIDDSEYMKTTKEGVERVYIGPKTSIFYDTYDRDTNDGHEVTLTIDGDATFSFTKKKDASIENSNLEVDFYKIGITDIYNEIDKESDNPGTIRLTNKEEYTFSLSVVDSWEIIGANEEDLLSPEFDISGDTVTVIQSFFYDSEAPEENGIMYEKENGYSYINGHAYISVEDTGVGLKDVTAYVNSKNGVELTVVQSNKYAGYTHKIELIEGEYDLIVHAVDRLDNETPDPLISEWINVDHSNPVITSVSWGNNSNLIQDKGLLSSRNSNFTLTWNDAVSTPSEVYYRIENGQTIVTDGMIDVRGKSIDLSNVNLSISPVNSSEIIVENSGYKFFFYINDSAGNPSSEYELPFTVLYDLNKPVIIFNNWDVYNSSGIDYVNSTKLLVAPDITIYDITDKSITPVYKVGNKESTIIEDIIIDTEGDYELEVIVTDDSGHTERKVLPFNYDITAPTQLDINYKAGKKEIYKGGETIQIDLNGVDVENFYYQIVDQTSDDVLIDWVEVPKSISSDYGLILPRIEGIDTHTVIINLKAVDIANNFTGKVIPSSGNIYIDNTGEYLNVTVKPWIGKDGKINARWEYFPDKNSNDNTINSYNYKLHKVYNGIDSVIEDDSTEFDFIETVISEDNNLEDRYYFEISAIMSSSRETESFNSIYANNDFQNPVILSIETGGYASSNNLNIKWESQDNSGIANVKAMISWFHYSDDDDEPELIEKSAIPISMGQNSAGFGNISKEFDYTEIENGDKVEITLIVQDLAGNISQKDSAVIIIDNTPPEIFYVVDQGDYINPNPDVNNFYFEWLFSEDDKESPIEKVEYQLTENGVVISKNWIELIDLNNKYINFSYSNNYENGATVVLVVKKTNAAGLSTTGLSNGIVLDSSAGEIQSADFTLKGQDESLVFYTHERELTLCVDGYDEESGVTRIEAGLGCFDEFGNWIVYDDSEIVAYAIDNKIDIFLPSTVEDTNRFRYRIVWYNGTDTASQPFYSKALVYKPSKPEITSVEGFYQNNSISVNWISNMQIPFVTGKVKLFNNKDVIIREVTLTENRGLYNFETNIDGLEIVDGEYYFTIELTDMANSSPVEDSNTVVIDTTPPEIVDFDGDSYVSTTLSLNLLANENITNYSFKLGIIENPSEFTSNWIEKTNSGSCIGINSFDLIQFSNLSSIDQSVLQISIKFMDRYGNWSDTETALVFVDLTPPDKPVISKDREISFFDSNFVLDDSITYSGSGIDDVLWESSDSLSGITAYRWSIVRDIDQAIDLWREIQSVSNDGNYSINLANISLVNEEKVYVALQVLNGSGLFSETGYSDAITVDLVGPDVDIVTSGEVGKTQIDAVDISTYNTQGEMLLEIEHEISDIIYMDMKIFNPSNTNVYSITEHIDLEAYPENYQLLFKPELENYGVYNVIIELYDPGMNKTTITKAIRHNSPPYSYAPEDLESNPGRPLLMEGYHWFSDSDGVRDIAYSIYDGENLLWTGTETENIVLEAVLYHRDARNNESIYNLKINAVDDFGAVKEVEIPFNMVNTRRGRLYTHEYWSETHIVERDIIVPNGINLTILNNTNISINTGALNGYGQTIVIESGASLIHEGNAHYYSGDIYGNWGGIIIEGTASLNNIIVEDADRGITLDSSDSFSVNDSSFQNNTIGLHIINSYGVSINHSTFNNNHYYGIKEEIDVNPVVTNSIFQNNSFDYYDFIKTVIDFEELNNTDTNSGNRGKSK